MQDSENPFPVTLKTTLAGEPLKPAGQLPPRKSATQAARVHTASPSIFKRMVRCLIRAFTRRPQKPISKIINLKEPRPVVFKSTSVSTFITPLSIYAGKPLAATMRASAIEEFNRMKSSAGATVN